ncbi:putative bifunctional diguanylate cyclase/phosphodiesterase [Zavarzinia sp. CC-PAN008]|uniref:putative bifunctional diguanylate cyclase/phosphodiesterase n=1 Tax=Zavarzinia sp. CC-PAN008 TaxID=3243332 RepID=UPI003F742FCF
MSADDALSLRTVFVCRLVALCMGVLGLLWLTLFLALGQYTEAALEAPVLIGAGLIWALGTRGQLKTAMVVAHVQTYLIVVAICLYWDVPDGHAPRVVHLFLLPMAFVAFMTFRRHEPWLRFGFTALNLATFVVFSSALLAFPWAKPLPPEVRVLGSWVQSAMAVGGGILCLAVMQTQLALRGRIGRELHVALWNRQFLLHYQPQVDRHGRVLGAEALIRWQHPTRGMVPPGEFIPAAEMLGIMYPIGTWVLDEACRQLARWAAVPDLRHLSISVNVSSQQFFEGAFVDEVFATLARHGIEPRRLKLELTESVMVGDPDDVAAKMRRLRHGGIDVALDDFGTGYSSLKYLKDFPLAEMKIDRAFVRDMLESEHAAVIAKGIISLGRQLGLTVIAEGVETVEQQAFLIAQGCTQFQGFLFGRPMPAEDIEGMVLSRQVRPVSA